KMDTVLSSWLAFARSTLLSALKSAATIATGFFPVAKSVRGKRLDDTLGMKLGDVRPEENCASGIGTRSPTKNVTGLSSSDLSRTRLPLFTTFSVSENAATAPGRVA